jgi:hypothetical protein
MPQVPLAQHRGKPKDLFLVSVATLSKGACRAAFLQPAIIVAVRARTGLGNAKEAQEVGLDPAWSDDDRAASPSRAS